MILQLDNEQEIKLKDHNLLAYGKAWKKSKLGLNIFPLN